MPYKLITAVDPSQGLEVILQYLNEVTGGLFMPSIVFMIYIVLGAGSYFAQLRIKGTADAAACFAASSYAMVGFVAILSMIPGAINGVTVVEVAILTIVGTAWLIFSKTTGV